MTNRTSKAFLYLALTLAVPPSYGAALVTLTSPTEKPTLVSASATLGAVQSFHSDDTTLFDETARSSGSFEGAGAGARAHLTLSVSAHEIRSTFDTLYSASTFYPDYAAAGFSSRFSLDIVVDVLTPFSFGAQALVTAFFAPLPNEIAYRFYTPSSNSLDVSFSSIATLEGGTGPSGGTVTGVLVPGEMYRLEFESRGFVYVNGPNGNRTATATGSVVFSYP